MSAKHLRVLHIDDAHTWRGGQHQVYLLIAELHKLGVAQALASPGDSPLAEKVRGLGVEVFPLRVRFPELDLLAPRALAAFAKQWGATLLHAHTGHAHALGLNAVRKLRPALPLVITRRVDFPIRANLFSRRKYTAPGQHFIAISSVVRDVLIAGGVAPEKITIVHSGVPPTDPALAWPRERVRQEFGIPDDEIAILNVGALTDHKGHKYLIEAAPEVLKQFPSVRFHVFGEGELHSELRNQINVLNLNQKVILHGHVPDARLKLAGFDLFVSSSHLEGLGTAILDAMLARLPVVAAAAGGIVDIVKDRETGWLAENKNPGALSQRMIDALNANEESARSLTASAQRLAETQFSATAMAQGVLHVYQRLLT